MSLRTFVAFLLISPVLFGQTQSAPANGAPSSAWGTRTIQLKYLDPDQLRSLFSGHSYVMEVNRELKVLTISGPTQFLDEVEQTGKRFDIPPALPANIEVTVYLLATAIQAPLAKDLPPELQAIAKTLESSNAGSSLKLADSESLRVREGQGGDLGFSDPAASGVRLSRISLQSAFVSTGIKGDLLSLTGLHCWLGKLSDQASQGGDLTASIDVAPGETALVARSGLDKPLIVVVRASVSGANAKSK